MLPVTVDADAPYIVLSDTREGYRLILLPSPLPAGDGLITPLWSLQCSDARSMQVAGHWCEIRRAQWPAWGAIAEKEGAKALAVHIAELMSKSPIGEVHATVIQKDDDPRVLKLGELLSSSRGLEEQILYRHRFATKAKRRRFFDWVYATMGNGSPEALMDLGVREGTRALAKFLEAIAAGNAPDLAIRKAA